MPACGPVLPSSVVAIVAGAAVDHNVSYGRGSDPASLPEAGALLAFPSSQELRGEGAPAVPPTALRPESRRR